MSGRRANGESTVTKRKDGRYQGAAYVLASDGTRRRRYGYGKTREEVHDRLIALMHRSKRGLPVSVERWTVERWRLHWHAEVVRSRLRATTLSGYGIVIRNHLVPAFGSKLLDRLTPQDVRRLLARARERGLSVRMVQYIHAVLRNALTACGP